MAERLIDIINDRYNKDGGFPHIYLNGEKGHASFGAGRIGFDGDGSGWLAKGSIQFDKNGNLDIFGRLTSNYAGDRLVIDPTDRSMKMINAANQEVVKQDFFVNNNYSGGQIQVNLVDQTTGSNHCHAIIDGGKIAIYRDGIEFARFDAYQKKIWIDADALPQGRDNAYAKEVYMDGETMKIRREQ